tara:strand:+ start:551 stop:667 length:117 start_codon:yes stop_codon:yes gene_type:complete
MREDGYCECGHTEEEHQSNRECKAPDCLCAMYEEDEDD